MSHIAFDYTLIYTSGAVDLKVEADVDLRSSDVEITSVRVAETGLPFEPDMETRRCLTLDALDMAEDLVWREQ